MDFDPLNSGDYHRFESTNVGENDGNSHGGGSSGGFSLRDLIKYVAPFVALTILAEILIYIGRS